MSVLATLAYQMVMQPAVPAGPSFKVPSLIWFAGSANGAELTSSGTIAGDLFIGLDSANNSATPPAVPPTGTTGIGSGIGSDETTDVAMRLFYKFAAGANETIPLKTGGRRVWLALRDVDPDFATYLSYGVTFAYAATTGANYVVPALGTLPRPGVVLTFGRRTGADTNFGTTLIHRQNSGSGPAQAYWTGASNTLGSQGTEVPSFAGESHALDDSTAGRTACSIWLPGAPI